MREKMEWSRPESNSRLLVLKIEQNALRLGHGGTDYTVQPRHQMWPAIAEVVNETVAICTPTNYRVISD